ncbi:MAG: hypothetical protein A2Y67_02855 [Candidatus Buchananbacteria bacterium RBG_13_39_9]|uniref:Histone deacetylase domain-containing protein n=1 Tax=Candidatus Buchananbacteria bacterium RBG_13_39_9 TaxID=1797531 RepID=A0A1G1XTM2_9BACT|nr:MAG: hypothetical protein A2Y67_02855 [Candidatus Buchananbacteria bacterium RBG_13_39_9]
MKILFNKKMLNYGVNSSPEGSYRLRDFTGFEDTDFNGENFIPLIYDKKYIQKIKKSCECKNIVAEIKLDNESCEAAFTAIGLSILASKQNDFAVIRPPGHHAGKDKAFGFCLFNNIAIAAKSLVNEGKRVCILDIDGHHGNGTQSIFYSSNKVLYCSIHQQNSFPHTGSISKRGRGDGFGYNINIPIAEKSGDDIFLLALEKMLPNILKFKPDIIAVSAGFDGYHQDALLNLNYSLNAFYECGVLLRKNFNNIFAVLEGGYHNNIKKCIEVLIAGINGNKILIEEKKTSSDEYCYLTFKNNVRIL